MKKERNIQAAAMLALSKAGCTVWRNETAGAWVGRTIHRDGRTVTLAEARMIKAGLCVGSADLIGITPVTVTADMVGKQVGVFTAVEVKTPGGRVSADQRRFLQAVVKAGGLAEVAYSAEDVVKLLTSWRR